MPVDTAQWRPHFDGVHEPSPADLKEAFRRAFDLIYQKSATKPALVELAVNGAINNSNKVFTLSAKPANLLLFRGTGTAGATLQRAGQGFDFTINDKTITVATAPNPANGDWFRAFDAGAAG